MALKAWNPKIDDVPINKKILGKDKDNSIKEW